MEKNLENLSQNPYPGRIIIVGLSVSGDHQVVIYGIMGRSENSRNRVFEVDHDSGLVKTAPADPSKVKDPSLIIYDAMLEDRKARLYAVSNGEQTKGVLAQMVAGDTFDSSLRGFLYEPDRPNYTPRITAVCRDSQPRFQLGIVRKGWDVFCERHVYSYDTLPPGVGMCMHTYSGDGDPLPPFVGEPYPVPIQGELATVAARFWDTLNSENKISLAVKFIDRRSGVSSVHIINKYSKVVAVA